MLTTASNTFNRDTDFMLAFVLRFGHSSTTPATKTQMIRTAQLHTTALKAVVRQLEGSHQLAFADTSANLLYCPGFTFSRKPASDSSIDCRVILALRLSEPSAKNANMVMDKLQSLVRTNLKAVDFRGCEIAIRKTNRFRCPWELADWMDKK